MAEGPSELELLARRARDASGAIALAPPRVRTDALLACAEAVERAAEPILAANAADLARAEAGGTSGALLDRLRLDAARVASMAAGLRGVAGQPDPVGRVVDGWTLPNGLRVRRVRVPLGTIGVIYEARPNVTADAAALSLR